MVLVWLRGIYSSGKPQVASTEALVTVDGEVHVGHGVLEPLKPILGAASGSCNLLRPHNVTPFLEPDDAVREEACRKFFPFVVIDRVAVATQQSGESVLVFEKLQPLQKRLDYLQVGHVSETEF